MLLLKANVELKKVFVRLIGTVQAPVEWTGVFAIVNNNLILAGKVRSLLFDFDNRKVYTNILDIPLEDKAIDKIPNDALINNMLNMILYAFGKWGSIGGLKVDKDYATLGKLFESIFAPVRVEPAFTKDYFHFFKNGIQITYEEAVSMAVQMLKEEGKLENEEEKGKSAAEEASAEQLPDDMQKENEDKHIEEADEEYELGLWHNMCWRKTTATFRKTPRTVFERDRERIGRNYYMVDYHCPECEEKLYMAVYPTDEELLIETDEARVYIARSYTCSNCNRFYTPTPGRLLQEGEVYCLEFGADKVAYEDYLELLGKTAQKTVNQKFNEYESDRLNNKAEEGVEEAEAEETEESEEKNPQYKAVVSMPKQHHFSTTGKQQEEPSVSRAKIKKAQVLEASSTEQMKTCSVADEREAEPIQKATREEAAEPIQKATHEEAAEPIQKATREEEAERGQKTSQKASPKTDREQEGETLSGKTTEELKMILKSRTDKTDVSVRHPEYYENVKKVLHKKLVAKYDARTGALEKLTIRQLEELKKQIQEEECLTDEEIRAYIKPISKKLDKAKETSLQQKVELSKGKTYEEIGRIIAELEKENDDGELMQYTLKKLRSIQQGRAEREVEHLILHMPLHLDRKQLSVYVDKINAYKDVDISPYRKKLDERYNMAEKEEITRMVNRGGKKGRDELWALYEQLKDSEYKEQNKEPFLEKIYAKIKQLDEARIEAICPSIATLSFTEGLQIYEQISQGMYLPELKTDTLEMIERRLTKLKTDESVLLMRKLKSEMEEKLPDLSGFYFYDAREVKRRENRSDEEEQKTDKEYATMKKAIARHEGYLRPYEYPILIADTTKNGSGREGFVLTPEHIFYHSFFGNGQIDIYDIASVKVNRGLLSKTPVIRRYVGKKVKLPSPVQSELLQEFTTVFCEFIEYLKEKPDSRNIEYLAKEKHEVKCCYRCGFTYSEGTICPKCGSKMNG